MDSDIPLPTAGSILISRPSVDVVIREGVTPDALAHRLSPTSDGYGDRGKLLFFVPDIGHFLIEDGCKITYQKHADLADLESLKLFLLGSCMGALLQQRGMIVLHGNAVSTDGKTCSIFVGESGAGKSTMAAWYYQQKSLILADDVVAITFNEDGEPMVIPSFPQLKLWQSSADLLGIKTEGLTRVRPVDDKYSLPILDRFSRSPLPVLEVVEIVQGPGLVKHYSGVEKLKLLQLHSYRYSFLKLMGIGNEYLAGLVKFAGKVLVRSCERVSLCYSCIRVPDLGSGEIGDYPVTPVARHPF